MTDDKQTEPMQYQRYYFLGIGGVNMSALAVLAQAEGKKIRGSDRDTDSAVVRKLRELGIPVDAEDAVFPIAQTEAVVYTAAISEDHPQLCAARKAGIPCYSRAEFLGALMCAYRSRIGVAGMHGKSTTTAMLTAIFNAAGLHPAVAGGAPMAGQDGAWQIGADAQGNDAHTEPFLFEACEYRDSFLSFYPTVAVLLNIDMDHVDYFHSYAQIEASFAAYAQKAQMVVAYQPDMHLANALCGYTGTLVTFSDCTDADYTAQELRLHEGFATFAVYRQKTMLGTVRLRVPGAHHVRNALAALAVAQESGVPFATSAQALAAFTGAGRRMEQIAEPNGVPVYLDYAHHPTELRASIATAKAMTHGRVLCAFQSHTYSRTAVLLSEFAAALREADFVLIAPIYAAREQNKYGVTPQMLAEATGAHAQACLDVTQILPKLTAQARPGDLILILGAGDLALQIKAAVQNPLGNGQFAHSEP